MSIQFRLNLLFGALLALALVSMISAMIFSAGPRVRAENDSIVRLTHEFIETAATTLPETSDPAGSLAKLIDGLSDLRHVRIYLEGSPAAKAEAAEPPRGWARQWLASLVRSEPVQPLRLPVTANGRDLGTVVIAPQAGDEIGEVLDAIGNIASRGLLLAVAVFALTSFVIHRALAPIGMLDRALGLLRSGDYGVRLAPAGPPEIARISSSLNELAAELERTREANRWLSQKVIRVEDDERRELARELHDELGPYLFAVRAGATSLKREIARPDGDQERITGLCRAMLEQIDAIQRTNRRVLHKLRPVGLNELGLAASLQGIVAMWRKDHPAIEVTLALASDLDHLDDTVALTVHRVVQEGLTNAFRHAKASRVDITVTSIEQGTDEAGPHARRDGTGSEAAQRTGIRVSVRDDGVGLAGPVQDGFGITGMRERVWALGGTVTIANAPDGGGALLEAVIPIAK